MANVTNATFRGFLIQARRMADDSPVGTFVMETNSQPACVNNVSWVTTHSMAINNLLVWLQELCTNICLIAGHRILN